MKILILEDNEERHKKFLEALKSHEVVIVETSQEAIKYLKEEKWDVAFLDHDLGGQANVSSGPGTGYEVAVWLSENVDRMPTQVYIHSMNPVGSQKMKFALPDAIVSPVRILFPPENSFNG